MARRALGPATLAVVQAVGAALAAADRRLVVACSGGADSLALAAAAQHVALRRGLPYGAVVVDHGLQPGSEITARAAQAQLTTLGYDTVTVVPVRVDPGSPDGPEAAARAARHAALDQAARPVHGQTEGIVLLGHTLDDQAETVLLGLARGSGARSLAGMAPRVDHRVRPLLAVRRNTTEQACAELGLTPWSDPHNDDRQFARVRVRASVLPVLEAELGPGIAEALARTAVLARDDADLLDQLAADADPGTDQLEAGYLAALPRALRTRVIRRWLLRHGAAEIALGHLLPVEALVVDWHGQGRVDLPQLQVQRVGGWLRILR